MILRQSVGCECVFDLGHCSNVYLYYTNVLCSTRLLLSANMNEYFLKYLRTSPITNEASYCHIIAILQSFVPLDSFFSDSHL